MSRDGCRSVLGFLAACVVLNASVAAVVVVAPGGLARTRAQAVAFTVAILCTAIGFLVLRRRLIRTIAELNAGREMRRSHVAGEPALIAHVRPELAALYGSSSLTAAIAFSWLVIGGPPGLVDRLLGAALVMLLLVSAVLCGRVLWHRQMFVAISRTGITFRGVTTLTLTTWEEIESRPRPTYRIGKNRRPLSDVASMRFLDCDPTRVKSTATYYIAHPDARAQLSTPEAPLPEL